MPLKDWPGERLLIAGHATHRNQLAFRRTGEWPYRFRVVARQSRELMNCNGSYTAVSYKQQTPLKLRSSNLADILILSVIRQIREGLMDACVSSVHQANRSGFDELSTESVRLVSDR